jgi:hypothetical protein
VYEHTNKSQNSFATEVIEDTEESKTPLIMAFLCALYVLCGKMILTLRMVNNITIFISSVLSKVRLTS